MVQHRTGRRPGFSIFQLIVVLVLLAMLVSFLVPALWQVRRAAEQTQAVNHLRQLGIAAHNFHDSFGVFPPAVGTSNKVHGTAHYFMLPFLEQENVFRKSPKGPSDNNAYGIAIPLFVMKDDPSAPQGNLYRGWLATTNYPVNWLGFKDGKMKIPDFTDGTSNTLLYAQRYQMCNGTPTAWGYDELYYWAPVFAYFSSAKFQNNPAQADCDPSLAQSIGSGNLQVGFADGSARILGHHLRSETWGHVCDPADGNPIELD